MESPNLKPKGTNKSRKRKKRQFNEIRKQMEFYFSDANLTKDRFLKQLVVNDPNVPLEVFMKFNKIKKIVDSVDDIAMSLTKSDLLKLSDDRTTVCRVTPVAESTNVDERTVYVESLPITATHEWLRSSFEQFGPVAYVSLPKYRASQRIKEFAFVEFEQISSVIKTLNAFNKFGGLLNMESEPENLVSIISYLKEQQVLAQPVHSNPVEQEKPELNEDDDGEELVSNVDEHSNVDEQSETASATRSENLGELNDFDGPPAKRTKVTDADVKDHDEHVDEIHTKKTRRRKSSVKNIRSVASIENPLKSVRSLRICTKIEWKRLRNKYLNEQHQQRKLLKQQLKSNKQIAPSQPLKKMVQNPRKINFYNANKEDVKEIVSNKIESIKTRYVPGVIVKVFFDEPCADISDFKKDMRSQSYVKYVDVEESGTAAFIRVDTARSAPTLIKHCAPNRCQILTGDNESDYWQKIEMDWKNKISKNVKVAKKKGRDKLAKVIATHVRFDE